MNKSDLKLIITVVTIIIISFIFITFINDSGNKYLVVYYENNIILKEELTNKEKKQYEVLGYNGEVVIETMDGKVRVVEENSQLHLCSKNGWIEKSYETIICLPNKIVIEIDYEDDLDAIIK